jgi:hypothetical protein
MQACDACRNRKLKCDRSQPCARCRSGLLFCTYHYKPKRKGPGPGRIGPRTDLRWASPFPNASRASEGDVASMPTAPSDRFTSSPPASTAGHDPHPATSTRAAWSSAPRRLPSRFLRRHVQSFLRHMFPIWPVVRANKTLANCSDPESLPLKGYCFLTALCAAASVQLNLESTRCEFEADEPADERHECYPRITPDYLL